MRTRTTKTPGRAACGLTALALASALLAGCGGRIGRTPGTAPEPPAPQSVDAPQPFDPAVMGRPGSQHQNLARFAGVWKAIGRTWPGPGADPLELKGTMKQEMILGDRFLASEWQGSLGVTTKFWAHAMEGFDKFAGEYVACWSDSLATGMYVYRGKDGDDPNVRTLFGEIPDPATGRRTRLRNVTTYVSSQAYKFESWATPPGGSEFKAMEILFTRQGETDEQSAGVR